MHIKHLNLVNFKNIPQAEIEFSDGINCMVGHNGAGKTNILDALYYLSFCKSYFNSIDSQNILHGQEFMVVQGQYFRHDEDEHIYCGLKKAQKKHFKRNKKEYSKLSDHIGFLPLVMISPSDEQLINDGSDLRRKYIDGVISQYDKPYLDDLLRYNRSLQQRNATLKSMKESGSRNMEMLELWDEQISVLADKIYIKRSTFIKELVAVFQKHYAYVSAGNEEISLGYSSHLKEGDLKTQLIEARQKDLILGYTTKGIHKDDLEMMLSDFPIKKIASQGQKKTFLIALKLAQYEFIQRHNGIKPILLLDDIFDKLDHQRSGRLLQLVSKDMFNQIFITHTSAETLLETVKQTGKSYKMFNVEAGQVQEIN
ncbi:DNA replication/repair protein RecF [Carboxylicivirga linearis]|uniref:DNA replication and repair protein RecF n=1 Tax=Carboxylicivirga linearis TaxID=1628157 RepID=A0ABS5JSS9_9BACT|nr:DNA replication/repair protein RecF [Carboxylicivirga linearis]MBS2097516.1 DNA replication/repair protein RecF [Carboxylicivirga linearis]